MSIRRFQTFWRPLQEGAALSWVDPHQSLSQDGGLSRSVQAVDGAFSSAATQWPICGPSARLWRKSV